ncbi:homocysteine S-methyltransferase family protein, partial [Nonomuraea sp. LPB2021202275-12-8]|uniref:homocysteine S-methyltransferase family protein n=1 Tax=Nonomuraea sp. LPB2021202275-12-8 TaxID=3120159 RepID=UPI00300D80DD
AARGGWRGRAAPGEYGEAAKGWQAAGASLLGGCARTPPEHIRQIPPPLSGAAGGG